MQPTAAMSSVAPAYGQIAPLPDKPYAEIKPGRLATWVLPTRYTREDVLQTMADEGQAPIRQLCHQT